MRNLMNKFRAFAADKSGAVTVDWVALTAAIVVIGIALVYAVFGTGSDNGFSGLAAGASTQANTIQGELNTINVTTPQIGS